MKRTSSRLADILQLENLHLAYHKASRGKLNRQDVLCFSKNLDTNLETLRKGVLDRVIPAGDYQFFTVHDAKKRTICAASFPERILHHAIMNVCDPVFERCQIFDSYAARRGKGTFAALERAANFSMKNTWFLKLDVRKYFETIRHAILKTMLMRLFRDNALLDLMFRIIDSYATEPGKGVPIGNLTSQYFANHYISALDHFVKNSLMVKCYVRYMDDIVIWHNDRNTLADIRREVATFVGKVLDLELKPDCFNRVETGVPFLGFRVFRNHILLRRGTKNRFIQKMNAHHWALLTGNMGQDEFQRRSMALTGHIGHANALTLRKKTVIQQNQKTWDSMKNDIL